MRCWFLAVPIVVCTATAWALEAVDPFTGFLRPEADLPQPAATTEFAYRAGESRLFKPEGTGPFPALVLMPACGGHSFWNGFDWAKRALAQGYVTMVVDPLGPRSIPSNCGAPPQVTHARLLKDAFDAAGHLRKQSFVDPGRIGLIGLSQGAMAGLGAANAPHAEKHGNPPFAAIVGLYPVCIAYNVPTTAGRRDAHFVSSKIAVPLLVLMGELDNEADPKDCIGVLDEAKAIGAPAEYRLYKGATHAWDATETRNQSFSKRGNQGQTIVYRYNAEVTEQSAKDAFSFLAARLTRSSAP